MSAPSLSAMTKPRWSRLWLRRVGAWLTTAGLFGLLLAPLVGAGGWGGGAARLVMVCTDHGTMPVALPVALDEDDGSALPSQPQPQPQPHRHGTCLLCLAHSSLAVLTPTQMAPVPVAFATARRVEWPAGVTPRSLFRSDRRSRAPPFTVV
jgi:hypothetical protein